MLYFCTYFDANYLHKGIALYRSIERQGEEFTLWILTFDDTTYHALSALHLSRARLIRRADFEAGDEDLDRARGNRKFFEYYWTCTPALILHLFDRQPGVDVLTYLDADLAFYGKASTISSELGDGSILLNLQDVSGEYSESAASGRFNVGVNAFRRSDAALSALRWWRQRCIEECRYSPEEGKYGDQHYLNDWPERFANVVVSDHPGLRAAPWNVARYPLRRDGVDFRIGGVPLICFHFHAVRFCTQRLVWIASWNTTLSEAVIAGLFRPYARELLTAEADLRAAGCAVAMPTCGIPWRYIAGRFVRRQPMRHFMWLGGRSGVV